MHFGVFAFNPRSKFVFIITVVLIIAFQILAWIVRSNYDLFNYNDCSFSMKGVYTCPDNQSKQCILIKSKDCDTSQQLVNSFAVAIIISLAVVGQSVLTTVLYYYLNGKIDDSNYLSCSMLFFVSGQIASFSCLCSVLSSIEQIKQKDLIINSFVNNMVITLCTLCGVTSLLSILIQCDLRNYFKYQVQTANQEQKKKEYIIDNNQKQSNDNIDNRKQLATNNQNQRDSDLQIQYYQPVPIKLPVHNLKQNPVQAAPFQEADLR